MYVCKRTVKTINDKTADHRLSLPEYAQRLWSFLAANDTLRILFSTINMKSGHQHKQVTFQLLH